MTKKQRDEMARLTTNHLTEWMRMRKRVEGEVSDAQGMFCVCGSLATGLHESRCAKFREKVNVETIKRLEHLL